MLDNFKYKSLFLSVSIIMLMLFCSAKTPGGINPGIQKTKKDNEKTIPENFDEFLKKFNADPAFQLSRVKFPFKITESPDEGEKQPLARFLSKKEWKKIKLVKHDNVIIRKEQKDKTSVTIQLMLEDTGVLVNHYFKCIKGEWWLIEMEDASD